MQAKDNLLTVKIRDIPLERVLTEIANQTWINIILYGPAKELVSADFSALPLAEGLKRLTRDVNHVLVYRPDTAKGEELEIKAMLIFPRTGKGFKKVLKLSVIAPEKRTLREPEGASLNSLVQALGDKDADVREEAVDLLAELKDERATVHLTRVLLHDEDPDVREGAAEALADLGGQEAIDPLTQALRDGDAGVRESAVEALAEIGGEKVVSILMDALRDEDEDVREAAADALEEITVKDFSVQSSEK